MPDYSALNEMASEFHNNSKNHLFYEDHEQLLALLDFLEGEGSTTYIQHHFDIEAIRKHYMAHWQLGRQQLVVTEVAEASEAIRKPGKMSDHVKTLPLLHEEYADTIIRVLDMCHAEGINISEAVRLKHEFNKTRPPKHGKAC